MITQFWLYFLGTGIVTRLITPPLHFRNKTITCYIRRKTNREIHHFHFGLLIFAAAVLTAILRKTVTGTSIFGMAVGLSLVADEFFIRKNFNRYFTQESLWYSAAAHIIFGALITIIVLIF